MCTSGKDKGRSPEWLEKILDWNTKQTDKEDYKCDHYPAGPIKGLARMETLSDALASTVQEIW